MDNLITTTSLLSVLGAASAFVSGNGFRAMANTNRVQMTEKAGALPFLPRPPKLDGTLPGDVGFDPANLAEKGDLAQLRVAELKHGRVCMLASLGMIVQEFTHWNDPTGQYFTGTNPFDAVTKVPTIGWAQIILTIGAIELGSAGYEGRVPGDYGFDPLNLSKNGIREDWATAEVLHGRLAMLATAAFIVQTALTGEGILPVTYKWIATLPGGYSP